MPGPFTLVARKVQVIEEPVDMELKSLRVTLGDEVTGSRVEAEFHYRQDFQREDGTSGKLWSTDVEPITVILDDREGVILRKAGIATKVHTPAEVGEIGLALRTIILDALCSGPVADSFGVTGQPIRDAGKTIISSLGIG
jgi:hypothetical protein